VIDLTRSCSRYRLTLIDFIDHGEVRPETADALAHLDRCTRCTEVVESTILTITALRRMGDEASTLEPPPDSWPRLRVRIQGWHRRPAVMSPLAGTLIGPVATPLDQRSPASELVDRQIEAEYISSVHQGAVTIADTAVDHGSVTAGSFRNYPDNYHPTRKEVGPVEPNGRPPEAI
jgi:hypothetical protein